MPHSLFRFICCALCSGLVLEAVPSVVLPLAQAADDSVPISSASTAVQPGFADLVERLLPAVVNVSVSSVIRPKDADSKEGPDGSNPDGPQTPGFPPHSPLEKFLHDYAGRKHNKEPPMRQVMGLGSGFIIDPSGVVVTNNHVIDNAQQITVILHDGTEMPARIVGRDSKVDLAVLQVKSDHSLPFVRWGKSDQARIGDRVLAIGNPLGLSGTVTSGIISSRKRNVEHGLYDDFIQTDAAINRGNSGGPLFNLKGEVIGINTLIYGGAGGGSIGLGFAIPSDDARGLIEQMRRTGHVTRGWLGVTFQNVTRSMADSLDFKGRNGQPGQGAILAEVRKKGPAARAGLQVGDIFIRVDGQDVTGQTLPRLVAAHQPGETLSVQIWRRGEEKTVSLTLGHSPEVLDPLPSDTHLPQHPVQMLKDLGLKVSVIDADIRTHYALSDSQRGVMVMRVAEGGVAAIRGIAEGNVITQVGTTAVNTPDAFIQAIQRVREMKKSAVLLLVQDDAGMRWVPIPLM